MAAHGHTRQRIIDTAAGLFQRQGYHATGMNQILAEGNAPKGSLYFHFPGGKEQLAAEAVRHSADAVTGHIDGLLDTAATPVEALNHIIDHLGRGLADSGYAAGCPIATVALEAAATSQPVRDSCRTGFHTWIERFAARLRADGLAADTAEELAVTAIAAIEGALLLARVRGDLTPLHAVANRLSRLIETTRRESA